MPHRAGMTEPLDSQRHLSPPWAAPDHEVVGDCAQLREGPRSPDRPGSYTPGRRESGLHGTPVGNAAPRLVDPGAVLDMQRLAGNQAAAHVLEPRRPAHPDPRRGLVVQRDAAEILHMSITPLYAKNLTPDEIVERLRLLEQDMARMDAAGQRRSIEYTTAYTNRRLLRDALGDLGRTAEQEMLASTYRLPRLDPLSQARVRLAIGGSRAWEALEHREALMRNFDHNQRRGMGIANYTHPSRQARVRADEELSRELAALGMSTPEQLRALIEVELPRMVLTRAKAVALGMLQQNEDVVNRELRRYGASGEPADIEGLKAADQELAQRAEGVRQLQQNLDNLRTGPAAQRNQRRGMGIANYTQVAIQQQARIADELEVRRSEYEEVQRTYGVEFPVLAARGYRPGTYANASREEVAKRTGEPLRKVLDNIAEVRDEIASDDMKVWSINRAISTAMLEMGLAGQPEMVRAVQSYVRRRQADEAFSEMVLSALAITGHSLPVRSPPWSAPPSESPTPSAALTGSRARWPRRTWRWTLRSATSQPTSLPCSGSWSTSRGR